MARGARTGESQREEMSAEETKAVFLSYASPAFALALRRGQQDAEVLPPAPDGPGRTRRALRRGKRGLFAK